MTSYKSAKEAFVSDGAGSSVWLVNSISLVAVSSFALYASLASRFPVHPALETAILVAPLLLSITSLAGWSGTLNLLLLAATAGVCWRWPKEKSPQEKEEEERRRRKRKAQKWRDSDDEESEEDEPTPRGYPRPPSPLPVSRPSSPQRPSPPSHQPSSPSLLVPTSPDSPNHRLGPPPPQRTPPPTPTKSFLTTYRASMMLVTCLAILAVDFPAFPRALGKTESWGTSLMDMGVGSFVFSMGLVSARPFLRVDLQRKPLRSELINKAKKCAPVLALGLIRVWAVKGVEYPEHVTEYGVHWNFFFTLGLLPIAAVLIAPVQKMLNIQFSLLGLVLSCMHQMILSSTTLQPWALTNSRDSSSLISENKEGLVSFPGYLSIFLIGLDAGLYILPADPYLAFRSNRRRPSKKTDKRDKLAMILLSYAILWWTALGVVYLAQGEVSRRLANLPYVLWTTAFNMTFLLLFLLPDLSFFPNSPSSPVATPRIFQAINANALPVFLIANLLTGLVNMSMQTMYASDGSALVVLGLYAAAVLGAAWALRKRRLKL